MSPLTEGQRRHASVMASLGGSSKEECAEATVDLHLLITPSPPSYFHTGNPNSLELADGRV